MSKKNMQSIVTALTPIAGNLPTQRTQPTRVAEAPRPKSIANADDPQVQFSFNLRKTLRKQLLRLADDEDMTMRSFILEALREKGLDVTNDDLRDLRKERG